jgi:hypothetical protein
MLGNDGTGQPNQARTPGGGSEAGHAQGSVNADAPSRGARQQPGLPARPHVVTNTATAVLGRPAGGSRATTDLRHQRRTPGRLPSPAPSCQSGFLTADTVFDQHSAPLVDCYEINRRNMRHRTSQCRPTRNRFGKVRAERRHHGCPPAPAPPPAPTSRSSPTHQIVPAGRQCNGCMADLKT